MLYIEMKNALDDEMVSRLPLSVRTTNKIRMIFVNVLIYAVTQHFQLQSGVPFQVGIQHEPNVADDSCRLP